MKEEEFEAMKVLLNKKRKLLDTTELVHSETYDKVVRELLSDEGGNIDYEKLKDTQVQQKFADKLKDHYLKAAREALGVKEEKGEFEDELLLEAYHGVTSQFFRDQISAKKHKYTKQEHSGIVEELKKEQDKKLTPLVYSKFKEEDIKDAIKYMKVDYINPKKLTRAEAIGLLGQYHETGLTSKMVEGERYYIKKP
ncbi:hypothetical protein KY347_06210 [Candidatus Woesearchaeota archaeon]|nr:hypothetical protein [Candidatus Woesearchaeota archaeon]